MPRGRLKIFLGYSSGVGKSFRMLDEGRRRLARGQDVVVGAVQPKTEGEARQALEHLPLVPMRLSGEAFVLDIAALLRRHPAVCLVDGLAYDNPPGCEFAHRWQEVEALLAAGISVIGSVNLQFVAERRAEVERVTGKRALHSIPEGFLLKADEIEVVDAPVSDPRRQHLSSLREIALLLAADVVDHQLEAYLAAHGITASWGTQERILACITPHLRAGQLIASGQRNAARFRGEFLAAYVDGHNLNPTQRATLDHNLELARAAGAEVVMLEGDEFVASILPFARKRGVTQIYVGHSLHRQWWQRLGGSHLDQLIQAADGMDIRVFPHGA